MDESELLAELDTYLQTRNTPESKWTVGLIECYQLKGAITRANDIAEFFDITYYVYRKGEPQEAAYYSGDVLNQIWRRRVWDYLNVTNKYHGRLYFGQEPKIICRILETAAEGDKWVLVTQTGYDPDTWQIDDITGDVLQNI